MKDTLTFVFFVLLIILCAAAFIFTVHRTVGMREICKPYIYISDFTYNEVDYIVCSSENGPIVKEAP